MRIQAALAAIATLAGLCACTSTEEPSQGSTSAERPAMSPGTSQAPSEGSAPETKQPEPDPPAALRPDALRAGIAHRAVRHLAGRIGPRQATGPAYREAASWVADRFLAMGYRAERQRFRVPAGVSWGVPVDAGTSVNVIATPPGFEEIEPHLILGAHLDTVPQAPGAEDNGSGVGVLLASAAAAANARTRLPVVFVAFGAEEPRGPTDDDHHYGSRAYVAALGPREREQVRGMLSLDRVGVGQVVPVCSAGLGSERTQRVALRAARRADVPTVACLNRSSDHWSFVRAGLPGARVGGTSYAGYHSADDLPSVVNRGQLERTGRLVLAWLAPRGTR